MRSEDGPNPYDAPLALSPALSQGPPLRKTWRLRFLLLGYLIGFGFAVVICTMIIRQGPQLNPPLSSSVIRELCIHAFLYWFGFIGTLFGCFGYLLGRLVDFFSKLPKSK